MEQFTKTFTIGNKTVLATFSDFEQGVDIDEILRIDYGNIVGELLTFPLILNRLGVLLAEMDEFLEKEKIDVEMKEDQLNEDYAHAEHRQRKKFYADNNGKEPTIPQLKSLSRTDTEYVKCKKAYYQSKKDLASTKKMRDDLNSLYWSAKAKNDIITKMTDKLRPEELEGEIIDSSINGVLIKSTKSLIS